MMSGGCTTQVLLYLCLVSLERELNQLSMDVYQVKPNNQMDFICIIPAPWSLPFPLMHRTWLDHKTEIIQWFTSSSKLWVGPQNTEALIIQ